VGVASGRGGSGNAATCTGALARAGLVTDGACAGSAAKARGCDQAGGEARRATRPKRGPGGISIGNWFIAYSSAGERFTGCASAM
jgi:hypothetical protein